MSYSEDLRIKSLECVYKGMSKVEVSKLLGISRRTLQYWVKRQKQTGSLKPKKYVRTNVKIDPKRLQAAISETPDIYQKELGKQFNVSQAAISKAFQRLKITRKKRQKPIKNDVKKSDQSI